MLAEFENFPQMLVSLRKHERLSQSKLAELMGVSFMTIRRWESGEVIPRLDEIKRLSEILHISTDELLNGSRNGKVRVVLAYDWQKYEGGIDMASNGFDVILGKDGDIGLKGSAKLTSREAIEEFLANVRIQVESAFEAQVKRGAIQPSVQGA